MGQRQISHRAAWIGLGAAASGAAMAYAVRGKSSAIFAPSVYRGVSTRPAIALTFDDGPSESTGELLEILERYRAPATFFQCGANVRRLPQAAREVAAAGHEIGNHSDTHAYLFSLTAHRMFDELMQAQETIEHATGFRPHLFRAPYGARWFGLREAQRRLDLLGVMWTTIGVDWKLTHERVTALLCRGARNGAIFCLHDGRVLQPRPDISVTLRAVERLLPMLIDKGYHFERVSDILCPTI
jgi:peptidoglycan/xylan/chitin deacetylase (PgdA/CDA1 family)